MLTINQRVSALDFILLGGGILLITKLPLLGTVLGVVFLFRLMSGMIYPFWGENTHPVTGFLATLYVLLLVVPFLYFAFFL